MDYRSIIESKYDRSNWQGLLYDIFRQKVQFWQQPQSVPVDENMAKCALYIGKITLPDGHIIAIYEVELSDTNGIRADYELDDGYYWSITKNGEMLMTGAESEIISDGAQYEFIRTK